MAKHCQNKILTWIDIKEEKGPAECGNPLCFSPEITCDGCFPNSQYIVLYDDTQRLLMHADFINNEWYSMTGRLISFITHWMAVPFPLIKEFNKTEITEKINSRFEIMDL